MEENPLRIAFDDSLKTGSRMVDVQHKFLIDIINDLADAIHGGQAGMVVKKNLNLLKYYTEWHFEKEEECMERFQCPAYEVNKKAHQWFIETFEGFQSEYRQNSEPQAAEEIGRRMYKELTSWLVKHIQRVDSQLAPCIHTD
ncbi:MAG: hemerythrin family protein [Acidobacteria bacterium]|nr:hemerythrin family protein [Acidobacteriota bacterium]